MGRGTLADALGCAASCSLCLGSNESFPDAGAVLLAIEGCGAARQGVMAAVSFRALPCLWLTHALCLHAL